jgi:adenine C2-methylase RlmN of 23S rRNA A2503 and tRNA A37
MEEKNMNQKKEKLEADFPTTQLMMRELVDSEREHLKKLNKKLREIEKRVLILETNPTPIHDHDYEWDEW